MTDTPAPNHLSGVRAIDLGRQLAPRAPHHPAQVPLMYRLTKAHGDVVYDGGISAANDVITMGLHNGTHVDAVGHFSADSAMWGGVSTARGQDPFAGLGFGLGIEGFDRILWHAVVADIPRLLGRTSLANDHRVTARELKRALDAAGTRLEVGCALLIRTGWGADWPNCEYTNDQPGPDVDAVDWAFDHGARLFGSDTLAFEWSQDPGLRVHRRLLVDHGVNIVEGLYLEELASLGAYEFPLVVAPLTIPGATAGPVRPVALVTQPAGQHGSGEELDRSAPR